MEYYQNLPLLTKNQNNMLTNKKCYVKGKSKEILDKVFKLGNKWKDTVRCNSYPFLFFNTEGIITAGDNMTLFTSSNYEEISAEEILAMEDPQKEKPKFYPFQKVLVRQNDNENWTATTFSHNSYCDFARETGFRYETASGTYRQCIDYKTNKHLVGKSETP